MNEQLDRCLRELDQTLDEIRTQRGLPSLSAAVFFEGALAWKGACGLADIQSGRPAHPGLPYPIGSITKVFVVTMLMQLVERGVVQLDDPLERYLPEYPQHPPHSPTTLRQLAAHTAGLPRDAAINFPMNHTLAAWEFSEGRAPLTWYAATQAVLASLKTVELEIPPDTAKIYSNLGIMLLGMALERACGQKLQDYMAANIFAPLGLASAGFLADPQPWGGRFPTGYSRTAAGNLFEAPPWRLGAAMYTGGIYATAEDLACFADTFIAPRSPILCADSIQRMLHPAAQGDGTLGWWKGSHAGFANFGHAGAHLGFIAAVLCAPAQRLTVAVQTNRWNPVMDSEDSTWIARELLARLCPLIEAGRPAFDPAAVDLDAYTGLYRLPGDYASAAVTRQDGLLRITLRGVEGEPLVFGPTGPHAFGPPGSNLPAITFEPGLSGRIEALNYALFRFRRAGIE